MSTRYRVEYQLRQHNKDEFIQWIKGLLATPFVLHAVSHMEEDVTTQRVRSQYSGIFEDIENLILNKIEFDGKNGLLEDTTTTEGEQNEFVGKSRLNQIVPSIGPFYTPLPLQRAFLWEDKERALSERRMVSPSFDDVRSILNTAQIFHFIDEHKLHSDNKLKLVTFDGDCTLYEDGGSITDASPVAPLLVELLRNDICIGIVTAAGYDEPSRYEERLGGLIRAMYNSTLLTLEQKRNLTIMGGESNYLFRYYEDESNNFGFQAVPNDQWMLPIMKQWSHDDPKRVLDCAQNILLALKKRLRLPPETVLIRKPRSVGLVPGHKPDPITNEMKRSLMSAEQLEEIVLTLHQTISAFPPARRIQFSCFDGGSDVWCDVGGKDLGVRILQRFYDPSNVIKSSQTLHIGDQFSPMVQANDIKARLVGATLWISNPADTVNCLRKLLKGLKDNTEF